jgi:hypothetical protein
MVRKAGTYSAIVTAFLDLLTELYPMTHQLSQSA